MIKVLCVLLIPAPAPKVSVLELGSSIPACDSFCLRLSFATFTYSQPTRCAKIKVPKESPPPMKDGNLCTNILAPLPRGRNNSEVLVVYLLSEFTSKIKLQLPTAGASLIMHRMLALFPSLPHFHIPCQSFLDHHSNKLLACEYLPQAMLLGKLKSKISV